MQQTLKSIENQFDRKKDSLIKGESSSLIGQLSIFDLGLD
jgi:hypothetical protein